MLSVIIYLYAGLLFLEAIGHERNFPAWTYITIALAWPVTVPLALWLKRRGK